MSQKDFKQKAVSEMRYFCCFIVGILLSLPVAANVTDENAPIAQKAAYLATKDMYHCQNPENSEGLNIVRVSDGKTKKVMAWMRGEI